RASSGRRGLAPVAALPDDLLDFLGGAVERLADLGHRFLVPENSRSASIRRLGDVPDGPVQVHHRIAEKGRSELADALEDVVYRRLILDEVRAPLVGDRVDLLRTFLDRHTGVAHVFE